MEKSARKLFGNIPLCTSNGSKEWEIRLCAAVCCRYPTSTCPNSLPKLKNKSLCELLCKTYSIKVKGGSKSCGQVPVLRPERTNDRNRNGFSIYPPLYVNAEDYLLKGSFRSRIV